MSYTVQEIIDRIRFNCATEHDLVGKNSNNIFSNKNISEQLKFALDDYAKTTHALEFIYSLPIAENVSNIDEPPYILRSGGIRFLVWYINGYAYPLNQQNLNNTYGNFPTSIQGLPKWFNYWGNTISFYPQNSNGFNKTSLTLNIGADDTILHVNNTSGFASKNGRITVGDEKIIYKSKDDKHFYGCTRGAENTTAKAHDFRACVLENNVWIYYTSLHFGIQTDSNDNILNGEKRVWIPDEHVEVICDYASYKLLSKIDAQRASYYKINFDEWLRQAKRDIIKGRSRVSKTGFIREPFQFETESGYWGM